MSESQTNSSKTPTFRKEERRPLRYQLSIAFAMSLSWLFWAIPYPVRMSVADMLGMMFYRFSQTYRENVRSNVRQVLGQYATEQEIVAAVRSIFRTSARNFVDLLLVPRVSGSRLLRKADVRIEDWARIDEARALGKGVVLITGHIGCFDVIAQIIRAKGYDLTIVTGRTTSRFIFDGVTHLRSRHGNVLVEPTPSGVRHSYRALRRNEIAVFVTDRDFFQNGRQVSFFGRNTTLPPGAVRLARETGAVVVPIVSERIGRRHRMRTLEPFVIDRTSDIDRDINDGVQHVANTLEQAIRPNIRQWVMFQKVWPERPPGPVQVFPVGSPLESPLLERVASALPDIPPRRSRKRMMMAPARWVKKNVLRRP